jgi:hypothetical protein
MHMYVCMSGGRWRVCTHMQMNTHTGCFMKTMGSSVTGVVLGKVAGRREVTTHIDPNPEP